YYSLAYLGFLLPTVLAALTPVLPYTGGLAVVAAVCVLCLTAVAWGLRRPLPRPAQRPSAGALDEEPVERELVACGTVHLGHPHHQRGGEALEEQARVHEGQAVALEVPDVVALARGVDPGGARGGAVGVVELGQQHLVPRGRERAGGVAAVALSGLLPGDVRGEVLHQHRGLLADGGTGLRVRGGARIAESEDVLVADVLQRVRVDLGVPSRRPLAGQRRRSQPVRSGLRRHGMEEVVLDRRGGPRG